MLKFIIEKFYNFFLNFKDKRYMIYIIKTLHQFLINNRQRIFFKKFK